MIAPLYIVVHYTSNEGDTAKNNADYFARESVKASAHFFCGRDFDLVFCARKLRRMALWRHQVLPCRVPEQQFYRCGSLHE